MIAAQSRALAFNAERHFAPVKVSRDRIIREVVGLLGSRMGANGVKRGIRAKKTRHKLATEPNRSKKRNEGNRGLRRSVVCGKFDPRELFCFRIPNLSL